jgi:cell division protein FtsZ
MLADASHVLVQVSGGPGMTLTEVEILMQELGKHIRDETQIIFGTTVDSRMGNRLSVTLISSLATEEEFAPAVAKAAPKSKPKAAPKPKEEPTPVAWPEPPVLEEPEEIPTAVVEEEQPVEQPSFAPELIEADLGTPTFVEPIEPEPVASLPEEPEVEEPPQPRGILPKKKPAIFKEPQPVAEKKPQARQEIMQFEPVTRGRFEKSEPTIVEGQDLDVPTFLRKNVRVK